MSIIPGIPVDTASPFLFTPIREAAIDNEKREAVIRAINEGPGNIRDKNYYSREAIESFVKLVNGTRCFINHFTRNERQARPEGDLWMECGYFKDARLIERDGRASCEAVLVFDEGQAGSEGLAKARMAVRYNSDFPFGNEVYAGFSVNGGGTARGKRDYMGIDYNNVVAFTAVESVDMVTRPARGGMVIAA